ncbi:MAG TPA: LCP family protein [Candidatus Paceibacterota bacterium]|nr:LCP family protein [Candidatus Paceibacterota bacterium]
MAPIPPFSPGMPPQPRKSWLRRLSIPPVGYWILGVFVAVIIGNLLITGSHSINIGQLFGNETENTDPHKLPVAKSRDYVMPEKEDDRLDVLILGMRGEDDPDAADGGALLTDSIQVLSYDKKTHKSSLISIPRDLLVWTHGDNDNKLNEAYEYGLSHSNNSLQFIKDKISQITGVYIDNVVIFSFSSFKEIIDSVGGIDVTLDQPFSEPKQWGYPFSLPAGPNHLDGQNALYYARSRYSSTDFDRSRRQQQVMFALKDKLLSLNFFSDPLKTISVFNTIRSNIRTDIGVFDIKNFVTLAKTADFAAMKKYIISTDNLVDQGKDANGIYILTPKGGNFDQIKSLFQTILN